MRVREGSRPYKAGKDRGFGRFEGLENKDWICGS